MLNDARFTPTIPASDMERAKKFYGETLGLKMKKDMGEMGVVYEGGHDSALMLYQSAGAGTNQATYGTFSVDDLEDIMEQLRAKGVTFEDYDLPGLKTENGVMTDENGKAAWFKDTEGNILCISDMDDD